MVDAFGRARHDGDFPGELLRIRFHDLVRGGKDANLVRRSFLSIRWSDDSGWGDIAGWRTTNSYAAARNEVEDLFADDCVGAGRRLLFISPDRVAGIAI